MAKSPKRSVNEIVKEGMDVSTSAQPVDPDDASDVTLPDDDPNHGEDGDLTSRITGALEKLAARQDSGSDPVILGILSTLTAAVDRLTAGQMEGSKLIASATRKANRPSNEIPPGISVFNPRGEKDFPKPGLKCEMLIPWPAEPESLDREEIELLNLLEPGDYVVIRNDKTKVKVTVRCQYNLDSDVPSRLTIHHDTAFNNDYHRMMPPMTDMLRGMLKQNPKTKRLADLVVTMEEEYAFITAGKLNDGSVPRDGKVVSIGE